MPVRQGFALQDQAIGAGGRQPVNLAHLLGGEPHAGGHGAFAGGVGDALAGVEVQKAAGHVGEEHAVVLVIIQLIQAALAAAVAQRLPFLR